MLTASEILASPSTALQEPFAENKIKISDKNRISGLLIFLHSPLLLVILLKLTQAGGNRRLGKSCTMKEDGIVCIKNLY